jgi:hypothetical protein
MNKNNRFRNYTIVVMIWLSANGTGTIYIPKPFFVDCLLLLV